MYAMHSSLRVKAPLFGDYPVYPLYIRPLYLFCDCWTILDFMKSISCIILIWYPFLVYISHTLVRLSLRYRWTRTDRGHRIASAPSGGGLKAEDSSYLFYLICSHHSYPAVVVERASSYSYSSSYQEF